jgi:hypothetical protein
MGWKERLVFSAVSSYSFGAAAYMPLSQSESRLGWAEQLDNRADLMGYIPMGRSSFLKMIAGGRTLYSSIFTRRESNWDHVTVGRLSVYTPYVGLGYRIASNQSPQQWSIDADLNYYMPIGRGHVRAPGLNGESLYGEYLPKVRYHSARYGIEGRLRGEWALSKRWSTRLTAQAISLNARGDSAREDGGDTSFDLGFESLSEVMKVNFTCADISLIYSF